MIFSAGCTELSSYEKQTFPLSLCGDLTRMSSGDFSAVWPQIRYTEAVKNPSSKGLHITSDH